jgi:hypothetical protein
MRTLGLIVALLCISSSLSQDTEIEEPSTGLYEIEGKVYSPELFSNDDKNWINDIQIHVNSGEYKGFLRSDGTFTVPKVPSGSYILEIISADYVYEPVRVEINSKGKFRARKVNHIQPSQVIQLPYPLKLKALTTFRYFQQREQWKITDILFSPMILMMILPLLLLVLLPRIMNDPEAKKELESMSLPKLGGDLPEMSDLISKFLGGGAPQQPQRQQQASGSGERSKNKKRNLNN